MNFLFAPGWSASFRGVGPGDVSRGRFSGRLGATRRTQFSGRHYRLMAAMIAEPRPDFRLGAQWEGLLKSLARGDPAFCDLAPYPEQYANRRDAESVERTRRLMIPGPDGRLIGHFGTYAPATSRRCWKKCFPGPLMPRALVRIGLLPRPRQWRFVETLKRRHPYLADRLHGFPDLPRARCSCHLAACDVLLQPYVDGVSSRRTQPDGWIGARQSDRDNARTGDRPVWLEQNLAAAPLWTT